MTLLNSIRRGLASFSFRWKPYRAEIAVDEPDIIEGHKIYLEGANGDFWFAYFKCPCGCDAAIQLSLLKNDRPRWKAKIESDGTTTLFPSVWRNKGCKSHFFINRGRVIWAVSRNRVQS